MNVSYPGPGAKRVDGPVLLGTPTPVLFGTRLPYYWERAQPVTIWRATQYSSANPELPHSGWPRPLFRVRLCCL